MREENSLWRIDTIAMNEDLAYLQKVLDRLDGRVLDYGLLVVSAERCQVGVSQLQQKGYGFSAEKSALAESAENQGFWRLAALAGHHRFFRGVAGRSGPQEVPGLVPWFGSPATGASAVDSQGLGPGVTCAASLSV